jgi:ubiquinone/menaquinone biosynthesis C-methylase UbiE
MNSTSQPQSNTHLWDSSYGRRENFVFSPSDEVVRFFSRSLRRRVGLDEIVDEYPGANGARVVDIGCGLGRNVVFGTEMGLEMHGSDLSATAVEVARTWLARKIGSEEACRRLVSCDIRQQPWSNKFFSHAISDSALDSMPFEVAQEGIGEIARLVQPGGLFYCNLISGDETGRDPDFNGEEVVTSLHENGTIQSYFNRVKIRRLLEPQFEIVSCKLHQISDPVLNTRSGRWHVVSRRR